MVGAEDRIIARNRKAGHDYELIDKFEAGIVLTGTEVKSLREGNCQLRDAFVVIRGGEAWLDNMHISPYSHGSIYNVAPDRRRKLLLHKREIRMLERKVAEKGMSIVPLSIYFDGNNRVKVEVALARGKKLHDKRRSIARRDQDRDIARQLKERSR